jgi:hypothetical protein
LPGVGWGTYLPSVTLAALGDLDDLRATTQKSVELIPADGDAAAWVHLPCAITEQPDERLERLARMIKAPRA